MHESNSIWLELLQYASTYPSPHNSQPIKIKIEDKLHASVYYDKKLGLPAESFGIAFGYVCVGVFLEMLAISAHNKGYEIEEKLSFKEMNFSDHSPMHYIGTLRLKKKDVHEQITLEDIMSRQTSRLPYASTFVPQTILEEMAKESSRFGYAFHYTTNKKLVKEIIYVNQRTLFYDLEDEKVRNEIRGYLRYSKQEAAAKKDGLSAECLILPGKLLKFLMDHHTLWSWPLVGNLLKKIYLNSMTGVSQVAWLTGKFAENEDYLQAGRCFIRIWLLFTKAHIYLHPFGSVITNPRAHKEFCKLVGEEEKDGMAWMLFRYGYSKKPPVAFRRDLETMILP